MNLSRPKINALLALALFTFAFLAAEFRFDVNVGLLAGAERVVIAQGFILGASVLGFIGYAPLLGLAQRIGRSPAAVNTAAVPIAIVGLTQIQSPTDLLALEILGCVAFYGLGLLGAAAHHAFSLAFQDDPKLATGAGAAYAAGILMQFAVNLLNCGGIAELIVLGAATIAISALGAVPQETTESPNPLINPLCRTFARPRQTGMLEHRARHDSCLLVLDPRQRGHALQRPRHHCRANMAAPLFDGERPCRRHYL